MVGTGSLLRQADGPTLGPTFVSEDWPTMPDGFCRRAWPDIRQEVAMVMYRASAPWITESGFTITCCNDGLRPVIFRIERMDEQEDSSRGPSESPC